MKLINSLKLVLTLLVLGAFFIVSCSQEDDMPKLSYEGDFKPNIKSNVQYSKINVLTKGFSGARGSEQLLVFPDEATFVATVSELERQVEALDNAFIEYYKDLDEEELNVKEQEIGFSEELPLLEFLNEVGFTSLYNQIAKEEEEWLKQEELDIANDPDAHFIDGDNYRSLFNTDAEVQVGNSIYKLTPDGYFQILDGDVESLKLLEDYSSGRSTLPGNIVFVGDGHSSESRVSASDCKSGKSKSDFVTASQYKRRMKWKVYIGTPLFGTRQVYAETTNYKKGGIFGNDWVKYRTDCEAMVYGHVSGEDGNCDSQVNFNPGEWWWMTANDKKSVKHKIFVSTKTKPGCVKGYHYGAGGRTKYSVLTW